MRIAICLLFFFSSLVGFSQGSVSGTLFDEGTGEPLMFANVLVQESGSGISTDLDGKYQLQLEPGVYTLVFSYIGYQDKIISEVEVAKDDLLILDVTLSDDAVDLNLDVVVTAKTIERTENSLLLLRKKADQIQDGISSQEMSRYGVGDAAGALKKVTGTTISGGKYVYIRGLGDRYSQSMLNGLVLPSADPYRNAAQLDLVPTNLLDNIITSKTFTPDLPGTFTGGNVNLKTKSFPERFSLSVSVSAGYNSQNNLISDFLTYRGGKNDYLGYDDGGRNRPAIISDPRVAELGILNQSLFPRPRDGEEGATEIAQLTDQVIRNSNNNFTAENSQAPLDHGVSLAFGNQYAVGEDAIGLILSGSFKQSYSHLGGFTRANWLLDDLSTGELFNQGNFKETSSVQTPSLSGLAGVSYRVGKNNTITANVIYSHQAEKRGRYIEGERPDNLISPRILKGHSLVFIEREMINYQLGGEHVFPDLNDVRLVWKASRADINQIEPDTRFFEFVHNVDADNYNIPASDVQLPFHFFRDLNDAKTDLKLDLTIPLANKKHKIKMGGLYSAKDRVFNEYRYQITRESPYFLQGELHAAKSFADAGGDPDVYLAEDNIGIVKTIEDDRRPEPRYIIGNRLFDVTIPRNSYLGNENLFAGYGMIKLALSERLKFVGGARYEKTDISVESQDTFLSEEDRFGAIDVNDLLPSANLIFSLNENMNLRASFSRTLARPNLREIANFSSFDPLTKSTISGNPQLDRTNISNYDLRWEWFLSPGELISVSGYYKDFTNPITVFYLRSPNPTLQFTNVASAKLYGIEIEVRKNLGFVSSTLNNFSLNTNVSLIEASTDVREASSTTTRSERPFEGQAPVVFNGALVYGSSKRDLEATLSLNYIGDRLKLFGRDNTPDVFDRGRTQLDFAISKTWNDFAARITAGNLLNAAYVLSSEYEGQEYIYESFRRGTNFGINLSYTLR